MNHKTVWIIEVAGKIAEMHDSRRDALNAFDRVVCEVGCKPIIVNMIRFEAGAMVPFWTQRTNW